MIPRVLSTKVLAHSCTGALAFALAVSLSSCVGQPLPRPVHRPPPPTRQPVAPQPTPATPAYQQQTFMPSHAPNSIALLLPLSGPYATTAQAIRDGFLAAHYDARNDAEVRVYDVGDSREWLLIAYQRALNEGAGLIVGPLQKAGVAQLAAMTPPVPVVSLNYLDAGTPRPFNFYQFGLSPEDEARAAADDAGSRSLRRAAALVPEGDWGTRVLEALDARLQQWGGRVVASGRYRQGVSDQSEVISRLMGVGEARDRHNALTRALGYNTEFDAGRRNDIDFIFVGGRSQDARVLLPQFRFHRATGLPQYATSLVYDGSVDPDLDGLRFCDMPFMIDAAGRYAQQRQAAERLPAVTAYPRLYALGLDAYRLARGLPRGEIRVGDAFAGASGRLEWSDSSSLSRKLDCVEMRPGGLVPTAGL